MLAWGSVATQLSTSPGLESERNTVTDAMCSVRLMIHKGIQKEHTNESSALGPRPCRVKGFALNV